MLIQVFGRYPVATCRRLASKCDIAFENLVGVAADLHVWTIAVERLDPVGHAWAIVVRAVSVVSTVRVLVWSWSHDTCLTASAIGTGWAASACHLFGDHNGGVSCGFIVCDRRSGGSWFCNARRPQSINSEASWQDDALLSLVARPM